MGLPLSPHHLAGCSIGWHAQRVNLSSTPWHSRPASEEIQADYVVRDGGQLVQNLKATLQRHVMKSLLSNASRCHEAV